MKLPFLTTFSMLCILITPVFPVKTQCGNHIPSAKIPEKTFSFYQSSPNHQKTSGNQDGKNITNALSISPGTNLYKELEAHETIYFCTSWQQAISCDIFSNTPEMLSCFLLSDTGETLNCQRQIKNTKITISYYNSSNNKGQHLFIKITNKKDTNQEFQIKLYNTSSDSQNTETPQNTAKPKQTEKPKNTPSSSTQTTKPKNTPSAPTQTTKPKNTPSSSTQTTKPKNTPSPSTQTSKPRNTPSSPTQTTKPKNTPSNAKQITKPKNTPSIIQQTTKPKSIFSIPKQTVTPNYTSTIPKQTSDPKNTSSAPKQTSNSENTLPVPNQTIFPNHTTTPTDIDNPPVASNITSIPQETLIPNTSFTNQSQYSESNTTLSYFTDQIPPLEEHFLELKINASYQLTVNTSNPVIWSSTNPDIVSVEQGKLEVHKNGIVIIYCHYPEAERGSSCFISSS